MDAEQKKIQQGRWKLLLVILVCAMPLLASYFTYYVIKPTGRTNYGTLLDPRLYPMPVWGIQDLSAYKGKWILLQVSSGSCSVACKNSLLNMRQLRLMQGKDKDRIERVLLLTDQQSIDSGLQHEYDGTHFLPVEANMIKTWLPIEPGGNVMDRIYLIDPLGNLIMRYPVNANPNKVKKDLTKLLKASGIG